MAQVGFALAADVVRSLAIDPEGRIIAAGSSAASDESVCAVARLARDGGTDGSFGSAGKVELQLGSRLADCSSERCSSSCEKIVLGPDGAVLAAASVSTETALPANRWALARFDASGALDPTFGEQGTLITRDDDLVRSELIAAAIGSDGTLVVAGRAERTGRNRPFEPTVRRYLPDLTLDPSFGNGGTVRLSPEASDVQFQHVLLTPDGGVVLSGHGTILSPYPVLGRLTPSGALDPSFAGDGFTRDYPSLGFTGPPALIPDGIYLTTSDYPPEFYLLMRFAPHGERDRGFGADRDGHVVTGALRPTEPPLLAVDADGRIVLAWRAHDGDLLVERRHADGTADGLFGDGGTASLRFAGGTFEPRAIALQGDDRILLGGAFRDADGGCAECSVFAIVRIIGGGEPDE